MNMQMATKYLISALTKGTRPPLLGLGLLAVPAAPAGGQRPIMADYVTLRRRTDGPTAAGGCSC
jgi:hypothetical protein